MKVSVVMPGHGPFPLSPGSVITIRNVSTPSFPHAGTEVRLARENCPDVSAVVFDGETAIIAVER